MIKSRSKTRGESNNGSDESADDRSNTIGFRKIKEYRGCDE